MPVLSGQQFTDTVGAVLLAIENPNDQSRIAMKKCEQFFVNFIQDELIAALDLNIANLAATFMTCLKNTSGATLSLHYNGIDWSFANGSSYLMPKGLAEHFKKKAVEAGSSIGEVAISEFNATGVGVAWNLL